MIEHKGEEEQKAQKRLPNEKERTQLPTVSRGIQRRQTSCERKEGKSYEERE